MVFICKIVFVKNVLATRDKKKKAYLIMTISILVYALIFIAFGILKAFDISIASKNPFDGLYGTLFIVILVVLFLLSLLNLIKATDKSDIMVIGLRQIVFISALTDLVLIEEFVAQTLLDKAEIDISWLDDYFPLGVAALMLIIAISMFVRLFTYRTKQEK